MPVASVQSLCLLMSVAVALPAFGQVDIEPAPPSHLELGLVKPVVELSELLKVRRFTVNGQDYLVQVERRLQFADQPVDLMNSPEYSVAVSRAVGRPFRATRDDMDEASRVRWDYCGELGFVSNGMYDVTGRFDPGADGDHPDWNFVDGCVFDGVRE